MKTGKEGQCASDVRYEDSVCRRGNKEPSFCCNELKMYESQRAKDELERQSVRQASQCVCCCAEKACACVSDLFSRQLSSRQRFRPGSSVMRWIKANVSGLALWLTTNSIQTLFKHSPRTQRVKLLATGNHFTRPSDSWLLLFIAYLYELELQVVVLNGG